MPALYELTKMDIAALRKADMLSVHLVSGKQSVRAIKRAERTEKAPFAQDIEYAIGAEVTLDYRAGLDAEVNARCKCFGLIWLYQSQLTHATSIINTLRVGDGVRFSFYPDGGSNGYLAGRGIHRDLLYIIVYRKGVKHAQFEIEDSTCPDNTARMCQGVPDSDSFKENAKRYA